MSLDVKLGPHDQIVNLWNDTKLEDVTYNRWDRSSRGRYLVPSMLSGSDYTSGGLVPQSNYEAFKKTFKDGQDIWWGLTPGGYNTYGIIIDTQAVPQDVENDVARFLNDLQDYPLADEDLHSELEMEAQSRAWDSWVKDEFKSTIEKEFDEEFGDKLTDKKLDNALYELFRLAFDKTNAEWINEEGDSMHVNLQRLVEGMEQCPDCVTMWRNLLTASRTSPRTHRKSHRQKV